MEIWCDRGSVTMCVSLSILISYLKDDPNKINSQNVQLSVIKFGKM